MANIIKVLWVIIALAVYHIDAAALQNSQKDDLDALGTIEGDQTAYKPIEHLTVNESKVIIDLYSPQNSNGQNHGEVPKNESANKPLVQLVINRSEADELNKNNGNVPINESVPINENVSINENQMTETVSTSSASPLQLIPPATVNASIAQLEKETIQKQGQIIIRYEFSFQLNVCTFSMDSYWHVPVIKSN